MFYCSRFGLSGVAYFGNDRVCIRTSKKSTKARKIEPHRKVASRRIERQSAKACFAVSRIIGEVLHQVRRVIVTHWSTSVVFAGCFGEHKQGTANGLMVQEVWHSASRKMRCRTTS